MQHGAVEIDHARHEGRREYAYAAKVQKVDPFSPAGHLVISEVRVAMNDGIGVHRCPPGPEQHLGDPVARFLRGILKRVEPVPLQPGHGDQTGRREVRHRLRAGDEGFVSQHVPVERHMFGLTGVIEFLAQPVGDLLDHLVGINRAVHALEQSQKCSQLADVGFHRARHVRILQLAGYLAAVMQGGFMHLAKRGGMAGFLAELRKPSFPVRAQLCPHPPLDEWPAHRRGLSLQLGKLGSIFRRQKVGHGGNHLCHLHQRSFGLAQRRRHGFGDPLVALVPTKQRLSRECKSGAREVGAHLGGAGDTAGKAVTFRIGGVGRGRAHTPRYRSPSPNWTGSRAPG